jgi:hypothetical protein
LYKSLRHREGYKRPGDADDRQVPTEAHRGSPADFLRRHQRESAIAARGTRQERATFSTCLIQRTADPRNLKLALEYITRQGGPAAGPDGLRPDDLGPAEAWDRIRVLSRMIRDGTYRPGKTRRTSIPKSSGNGTRTIEVQNLDDRIVQRGINQIIQPFLDPLFRESSFGFRPHKGREHALALAETLATQQGLWTWMTEDIADAFDNVPRQRLLDILHHHIPADDLLTLVGNVIGIDGRRGIPQGGALSPLLLNVYLDYLLDRLWRKQHPDVPLIRVADDLLILTKDRDQAIEARSELKALLQAAGMPLKDAKSATSDLITGQTTEWLGYQIQKGQTGLQPRLSPRSWWQLDFNLARLHQEPDAPIRALETIEGWILQQGPCFPNEDVQEVYARIDRLARRYAFEELPNQERVLSLWIEAHDRWGQTRREVTGRDERQLEDLAAPPCPSDAGTSMKPASSGAPTAGAPHPSLRIRTDAPGVVAQEARSLVPAIPHQAQGPRR